MELECLTEKVIGCAITVHKALGPGFLESIYENALVVELEHAGLRVDWQLEHSIQYRDVAVGLHRLDLLIEGTLVVELKATSGLEDIHFSQVRSYLKALNLKHALLLNFASMPLTIKRVIFEAS